jgi:hypothetical protein
MPEDQGHGLQLRADQIGKPAEEVAATRGNHAVSLLCRRVIRWTLL